MCREQFRPTHASNKDSHSSRRLKADETPARFIEFSASVMVLFNEGNLPGLASRNTVQVDKMEIPP